MAKFDTVLCMTVKIKLFHTISYELKRVHALLLSVSFKPIFVDFTLVIDMLLTIYAMVLSYSHVPFFFIAGDFIFCFKKGLR